MPMVISIINHKGGVGKTTSAANIGAALHRMGKRVLLVDFDPQANLTIHFGFLPEGENIYDALKGKYPLPIRCQKDAPDIVAATIDLAGAELELATEPGREYLLKSLLEPVFEKYDYILIDCPPALGLLTLNALSASNSVIVPIEPGKFAAVGMGKLFEIMEKVRIRINADLAGYKVLITKVDVRKSLHNDVSDMLREHYGEKVFSTRIRTNVSLEEAQMQGVDIFRYDARSNGAEDYINVSNELLKDK